jgi:hypothetical protein
MKVIARAPAGWVFGLAVVGMAACGPATLDPRAGTGGGGGAGNGGAVQDGGAAIDAAPDLCGVPAGTFLRVSAGNEGVCGIRTDGSLSCWGRNPALPDPGSYTNVSKQWAVCAVKSTGELACWGEEDYFLPVPAGQYVDVATGEEAACARRADMTVTCWGNPVRPYWVPAGYAFESITGGAYFVCGIETAGRAAVCWDPRGSANPSDYVSITSGPFRVAGTGRFYACGLRSEDDNVACWPAVALYRDDANTYGQLEAPPGPFVALSVGEFHACGLRADGQVACWGNNDFGQSTPPAGVAFAQLSVGSLQTCGILLDGTIRCWGEGCSGAPAP